MKTHSNTFGGTGAGERNVRSGNVFTENVVGNNRTGGIEVVHSYTTGNQIYNNRVDVGVNGSNIGNNRFGILVNGTLGIDLFPSGVTPNDSGDTDSGPNENLNFPVLASATSQQVTGTACGG